MSVEILWANALMSLVGLGFLVLCAWLAYNAAVKAKVVKRVKRRYRAGLVALVAVLAVLVGQPFRITSPAHTQRASQDRLTFDRHEETEVAGPSGKTFLDRHDSDMEGHKARLAEQKALSVEHMKSIQETQ